MKKKRSKRIRKGGLQKKLKKLKQNTKNNSSQCEIAAPYHDNEGHEMSVLPNAAES
jgi:hypothetical protein